MTLPHQYLLKSLLENPELLNAPYIKAEDDKKNEKKLEVQALNPLAANIGGNIWDPQSTLPIDFDDLQLQFMDIDDFMNENDLTSTVAPITNNNSPTESFANPGSPTNSVNSFGSASNSENSFGSASVNPNLVQNTEYVNQPVSPTPSSPPKSPVSQIAPEQVAVDFHEQDLALASVPGMKFDPVTRQFTDDELRPQPTIKKSKKVFVPNELKDDKYWSRRKKNNVAAKRSRDARRIKENQIGLRASFLEKENAALRDELQKLKSMNKSLKTRLVKYEEV